MRELISSEINLINGGTLYSFWEVVGLSALASGLAFGTMEAIEGSLYQGLKSGVACAIPTGIACMLLLASIDLAL